MILKSDVYVVKKVVKHTKAKFFENIKEGDLLQIKMKLKNVGGASGGGVYATKVSIENLTKKTSFVDTQTRIIKNLEKFELEEVI